MRLTERAHQIVAQVLQLGDVAIDATVGNGADTEFLAKRVGPSGRVLGIDIQYQAIDCAAHRLKTAGLTNVDLHQADHAELLPQQTELQGRVSAVMFNLGYLPHGDPTITTQSRTTVSALNATLPLLRPGGVLTILAYPGHPGGAEEHTAVAQWVAALLDDYSSEQFASRPGEKAGPHLFVVQK